MTKIKFLKALLGGMPTALALGLCTSCALGRVAPDVPTGSIKVTFDANGGQFNPGQETTYIYVEPNDTFDKFAHPTPTKDGSYFTGWFNSEGEPMINQPITEETTLTAGWVETPETEEGIIATINGEEWNVDFNSICSDDADIILTSVDSNKGQSVKRNVFNATSISIGSEVTYLDNSFLANCPAFTGSIIFAPDSQLQYIGISFLYGCSSFNNPITLPESVKIISSSFLCECEAFNSSVNLAQTRAIGMDFMGDCHIFSKQITISEDVEFVGSSFMQNCYEFNDLVIDSDPMNWMYDETATLVVDDKNCTAYGGVSISGDKASEFLFKFKNIDDDVMHRYRILKAS